MKVGSGVTINGTSVTVTPHIVIGAGGMGVVGGEVSLSSATTFRLGAGVIPTSAGAPGAPGDIRWNTDSGTTYLYICIATNTWERVALATW